MSTALVIIFKLVKMVKNHPLADLSDEKGYILIFF